jgi:hypothetical protein
MDPLPGGGQVAVQVQVVKLTLLYIVQTNGHQHAFPHNDSVKGRTRGAQGAGTDTQPYCPVRPQAFAAPSPAPRTRLSGRGGKKGVTRGLQRHGVVQVAPVVPRKSIRYGKASRQATFPPRPTSRRATPRPGLHHRRAQVSYLEIYNEQLYDLLGDSPGTSDSLAVLEDSNNNTYVRGLTLVPVSSEEEALAQFFLGEQGRTNAGHVLNAESSRSHTVFTVHLEVGRGAVRARVHVGSLVAKHEGKASVNYQGKGPGK